MDDRFQSALAAVASQSGIVRSLAVFCAGLLVYLLLVVWLLLVWRQRESLTFATVARIGIVMLGAILLARIAAQFISNPRPYIVAHTVPLMPVSADNGFPSDHTLLVAALTATVYGIDRRWIGPLAAGTLLVALGRLAVGAHHTVDVVGSVVIVLLAAIVAAMAPLPRTWNQPVLAAFPRVHALLMWRPHRRW